MWLALRCSRTQVVKRAVHDCLIPQFRRLAIDLLHSPAVRSPLSIENHAGLTVRRAAVRGYVRPHMRRRLRQS
jgi:hypothetical protein